MTTVNLLSKILAHTTCWNDIYNELLKYNLPQENSAGKLFEELCKYYYLCEPTVTSEYRNVWLFSEIPLNVKEKLNLGKIDHGVDLLLEDQLGQYSAVQCKFRSNQNSGLSWSKDQITNLFAEGCNANYFIVFTNAPKLDKHSLNKKPGQLKLVTLSDLVNLSPATLNAMQARVAGKLNIPTTIKNPRDYQLQAIHQVINGFKDTDRGQLILPCGAGKTLVSLWIKEALKLKHTIVLVPSLALLRQIKNEWAANSECFVPYICVCSEKDIDNKKDNPAVHEYEIRGQVTTSADKIREFLKNNRETIIYSTYQSLGSISDAVKGSDFMFDLAICDEAHKTSGSKLNKFGLIHSDSNIPVKKRLYMTATPRVLSSRLKSELDDSVLKYLHDMSNPDIFGVELYRMGFKEAIDKGILVDYKIFAIGISDKELEKAIKYRKYISDNETIDEIANNFALEKFMQTHGPTHALTFHSSVKKAKSFQERHSNIYKDLPAFHVNGTLTTNDRKIRIKAFENSPKAIITNARCLTEGVDVPAIDVVYFCDPKYSKIDIVQSTGRALRRADHKGKKMGYVVVPIFHSNKESLDEIIEISNFKNLLSVVRALSSHDERLEDEIKQIKIGLGKRKDLSGTIHIDNRCQLITVEGFSDALKSALFDQIIKRSNIPWKRFEEARKFVQSLGLKHAKEWRTYTKSAEKPIDIPNDPYCVYKNYGWVSWGDWLGNGKVRDKKFRPFKEAREYARSLNLNKQKEWQSFSKSGKKPDDIPASPRNAYKNSGWISYGDWLGTGNIAAQDRRYRAFNEASNFAQKLNLKNKTEWNNFCDSGDLPPDLPRRPDHVYRSCGWQSWGRWLGTSRIANQNKSYLDFKQARKFVHTLDLKSMTEWFKYTKSNQKPDNIPTDPYSIYKNSGWVSAGDWLNTCNVAPSNKTFRPFKEAREFVHSLNLKGQKEWAEYTKSGGKPPDIPAAPHLTYRNKGWISYGDWVGTGTIWGGYITYRTFEEARKYAHSLQLKSQNEWCKYAKSTQKPGNIPANPAGVYKNKGWISWPDWLKKK